MIVSEIMKKEITTCSPQDDLATAARIMHEHHCGFVPVVDSQGTIAGVLTDRDVCLYAADKSRAMTRIGVKDVMSHPVFSCFPDENVKTTIKTMAKHHVRRLPVLDAHGRLQGVLSIDDVIQAPIQRGGPTAEEIVAALKGISAPRRIEAVPA
jgi:CBS domain-containing protein